MINRFIYLFALMCLSSTLFAQDGSNQSTLDQLMYSGGKIYVVAACLVIIFVGIIIYLVLLDRKVNRLEKKYGEK